MVGELVSNHAPIRSGLVRKAELCRNLLLAEPGHVPLFLPETHTSFKILCTDRLATEATATAAQRLATAEEYINKLLHADQSQQQHKAGESVPSSRGWILKPSESSNGNQIHPFNSITGSTGGATMRLTAPTKAALASLVESGRPWLVQRYIERPLLLRGCKTHCRAYVLVVGRMHEDSSVYLHREVPTFVSAVPWSMETLEGERAGFAHLTNRSVQQQHPDFDPARQGTRLPVLAAAAAAATMAAAPVTMRGDSESESGGMPSPPPISAEALRASMFASLATVVHGVFRALRRRGPKEFLSTAQNFELFGMDAMFDESHKCWLLEFNSMPALEVLDDDTRYSTTACIVAIASSVLSVFFMFHLTVPPGKGCWMTS